MIALKALSDFRADTVGEYQDDSPEVAGQAQYAEQKQLIQLDDDHLTTDITDLEMTEKTLQEGTAAFGNTTQICHKSLSEELEVLAKAKDVISEKTDDSEYPDNRSMLSLHGSLVSSLSKIEHSIGLTQLASRVDSAMHAETSYSDDPFAEVKGLISDMIARLEEKASEDLTSMISLVSRNAESNTNQLQGDIESVRQVSTRARCSRQTALRGSSDRTSE